MPTPRPRAGVGVEKRIYEGCETKSSEVWCACRDLNAAGKSLIGPSSCGGACFSAFPGRAKVERFNAQLMAREQTRGAESARIRNASFSLSKSRLQSVSV